MKLLPPFLALTLFCAPALPCTGFLVVGGGKVLFGNNEDYLDPDTRVWFVPAVDGRRGVMYLGFGNGFPQGGLNDAGLAFDGFATSPKELVERRDNPAFPGNPVAEAMETCTTVQEVVEFLRGVDLAPLLTTGMLLFADATGDSVIIEGDAFLRKEGDHQVLTNFYQSAHDDDLAQCRRYSAAMGVLGARKETSLEVCEQALAAAAVRGRQIATLYSNVFDLKARTARLYLFQDFANPVVLDLEEVLAKGARTLRLPDLFPKNVRFEAWVAYRNMSVEERIDSRRGPDPDADELEACEGDYAFELNGRRYELALWREDATLVAKCPVFSTERNEIVLHSETRDRFFMIDDSGEVEVAFDRDDQGQVRGFRLNLGGTALEATRLETER